MCIFTHKHTHAHNQQILYAYVTTIHNLYHILQYDIKLLQLDFISLSPKDQWPFVSLHNKFLTNFIKV